MSSSWFASLSEKASALSESALKATEQAVQGNVFQKLTLTTPELSAERSKIDQEERRKEHVKDKLAGLLPWETRDPDRDILVPECKEAILALSQNTATFCGPWQMPDKNVVLDTGETKEPTSGVGGPEDTSVREGGDDDPVDSSKEKAAANDAAKKTPPPSPESLEKLAKLEPLPNLLADFDLDSHVGLIQRVLQEDKQLVKMQSQWSGGGAREGVFWKNYFFHCAYSRYEAGLSVDEVWSEEAVLRNDQEKAEAELEKARQKAQQKKKSALQSATAAVSSVLGSVGQSHPNKAAAEAEQASGGSGAGGDGSKAPPEHEISFEEGGGEEATSSKKKPAFDHDPVDTTPGGGEEQGPHDEVPDDDASPSNNTATEYDIVDDGKEGDLTGGDAAEISKGTTEGGSKTVEGGGGNNSDEADMVDYEDPELDELEAEILKELED